MRVLRPLRLAVPVRGLLFAESIHAAGFRMGERADPFPKLVYVLAGRVRFERKGEKESTVGAGAVLIVPEGLPHRISDETPATLLLLCMGREFLAMDPALPRLWQRLAGETGTVIELGRSERPRLEADWRRGLLEHAAGRAEAELGLRLVAAQMLLFLARRASAARSGQAAAERIEAVVREVDETFFEGWTLAQAAERAGLSRRRFSELFRARTGATFLDYLTAKRVEHAGQLLRSGGYSVLGVMFSCGFGDLSHFYRVFRAHFGQPPKQWIAALK